MYVSGFKARTLIVSILILTLMLPLASYAGSRGSRNTAIGLSGVAAYLLLKGKTLPGIAAAVGAGIAYNESQRDRKYGYYHRYDNQRRDWNYRGSYRAGDWGRYDDRGRDRDCYRHDNHRGGNYGNRWNHRR